MHDTGIETYYLGFSVRPSVRVCVCVCVSVRECVFVSVYVCVDHIRVEIVSVVKLFKNLDFYPPVFYLCECKVICCIHTLTKRDTCVCFFICVIFVSVYISKHEYVFVSPKECSMGREKQNTDTVEGEQTEWHSVIVEENQKT